jgi:PKD repeat protein
VQGVVSFEYGNFGPALPLDGSVPPPNANMPTRLGDVDAAVYDAMKGELKITLSTSKAEGVTAGQQLVDLNARTFFARPPAGPRSQNVSSDITGNGSYTLVGNASCRTNTAPTADLKAAPQAGFAPLTVNFDGSGSFDRDSGDRVVSYTFNFGDGSPELTQATPNASHTYTAAGNYFATLTVSDSQGERSGNTASAAVEVREVPPPVTETIEDDDARVAYTDAWHLINEPAASAGHFRYHTGNSPNHSATLSFDVGQSKTGTITYYFARSPKGGSADLYLDGVFKKTVSYKGSAGTTQKPEFADGYKESFPGLPAGAHRLEIRNLSGAVYLDRFVLESAGSNASPAAGPGSTTNQSGSMTGGQTMSTAYLTPPGAQSLSVVVESSLNLPFTLALVDSKGLTLQTVSASNGMATINRAVTPGGAYLIKVVNLNVGPLQITTTTTPLVAR